MALTAPQPSPDHPYPGSAQSLAAAPMLVTILVDAQGCHVMDVRPDRPDTSAVVPCGVCRERLGRVMNDIIRVEDGDLRLLTEREREVMHCAATGSTNRAIAARLGISLRTVENHLNRGYAKVGVSGRNELKLLWAVADVAGSSRHLRAVPGQKA